MFRNVLLACLALLGGVVALYAAAEREPRAAFTYVNPSDIHTLDPARMSWTQDFRIALNLWEGLTTSDPRTTEPVAGAARLPPRVSDDGLTYVFTIRPDARWSNGDAVVAADFLRGWRRALEPGTATDYTFLLTDHIAGAAGYVAWRREAVARLTALKRRSEGGTVDTRQMPALEQVAALGPGMAASGAAEHDRKSGSAAADGMSFHVRSARKHAAEMDERFSHIGARAIDDRTLEVRLIHPCAYFLDLAAFPCFLPCHESIELLRERYAGLPITAEGLVAYDPQWTKPRYHRNGYPGLITNGPFRLEDWRIKRRARLVVNPFYYDAASIRCRTIDMLVYDNLTAAIMAYEAGAVDFLPAMDVPYDHEIARLAQSGERPDFHLCQTFATYFLNFNCVSDSVNGRSNPLRDARVRRALSLALDKHALVERVLNRGDRVARSFVPPGAIPEYHPPAGLPMDVAEARRLLADAGLDPAAGPAIELLHVATDELICQAVARMWEENLGLRVELRSKESKTFGEDKAEHRYMIARGNWYGDYMDPTTFLDCLATGNGNNDSGYSNPHYDALLRDAAAMRDPAVRLGLLRAAEAILVEEDFPILPILHYATPIAIKPQVQGLYPNPRLRFPFRDLVVQR
ncbi:MAG: peptide ABC transporter substrate-binding protein [Planctomycetes bacterium]|nr:peptide ABC transporter substrate-binding protein [Planctomycetota bacterium]